VDDEGLRAMRKEVLEVLQRVERADSTVVRWTSSAVA
jgi:hypothetical protein